jgi:hypothetical protein
MLIESEHYVPCGRNAGLGVGVEFVELHWVDWSSARGGFAGNGFVRSIVTSFRTPEAKIPGRFESGQSASISLTWSSFYAKVSFSSAQTFAHPLD